MTETINGIRDKIETIKAQGELKAAEVELQELTAPHDHEAEPLGGSQELDRDQRQPGLRDAVPDADEHRGHGRRKDHLAEELAVRVAERTRDLDVLARHALDQPPAASARKSSRVSL